MKFTKRRSYKGKYILENPDKYIGVKSNIVWRSTWERTAFKWCDRNDNIIKWNSEETVVKYISPVDNKVHRYFVDLFVEFKNGKRLLIEIKPRSQVLQPLLTKGKHQKTILYEHQTFAINTAKWKSAKEYAKSINAEFVIFDENIIKQLGNYSV